MEVILLKGHQGLGEIGDIVNVKPGYARNFLFPKGIAVRSSKKNIAFAEEQKKTAQKRADREKPWTKAAGKDAIYAALLRIGKEHHYDRLIEIMIKDFNAKMKSLGGQTKGHFISLDNGGLDVAENFGPQPGRSTRVVRDGRVRIKRGN